MTRSYLARRVLGTALVANAVRPIREPRLGFPVFVAGWLTSELAPQLLGILAADTVVTARRHRVHPLGLALGAVSAVGYAQLIRTAARAGDVIEKSLDEGLGATYADDLTPSLRAERRTPVRELALPFAMRRRGVEVIRDINYTRGGKRARLDIYRPADGRVRDAPVLVQVHGGGWMTGQKEEQGQLLMNRLASHGWVCVAANYRLAPWHSWPAQIIDVKRAVAWTREHISSYGGDPSYVVITGGSAGGHLASLAALTPNDPQFQPGFEEADTRLSACVSFYGVYDVAGLTDDRAALVVRDQFLGPWVFKKRFADAPEIFEQASPIAHVDEAACDFFVLHGTNDTLVSVKQARAFVARLRERGSAKVLYAELPGTQHGFEAFSSIRSNHTIRAVERFLEWHRGHRRSATDLDGADAPR